MLCHIHEHFPYMFTELDAKVSHLVQAGYSLHTTRTYASSQKTYLRFCQDFNLQPVPASDTQIHRFIAYLSQRVSPNSIKVYLAAVRALHVNMGLSFQAHQEPRTHIMVRGLLRGTPPPNQKQPITYSLLCSMYSLMGRGYDDSMLWAALTTAFFGCLRADELTTSSSQEPTKTLLASDLEFRHLPQGQGYVTLQIKLSKTCPQGFTCTIGCSTTPVCAYCALAHYLQLRQQQGIHLTNPALFVHASGHTLTHTTFTNVTRNLIAQLGLDPKTFSGHSYRIGSSSSAGACGFKDWEIQRLGGWRSDTYKRYVRHSQAHIVSFAAHLAQASAS